MKSLLFILMLFTLPSYAHPGHHHLEGTYEWSSGIVSFLWNIAEFGMHGGEFLGYKSSYVPSCCGHSHSHSHSHSHKEHNHNPSKFVQAYHIIELTTHGLNLFDVTSKISDSISDTIEEYIPTQIISTSTLAFNLAVIAYRAKDIKQQFKKGSYGYGFALWGLLDACGHINSIWLSFL